MVVTARPAPGREIGPDTFADLTDVPVTEVAWAPDGFLAVTFETDLTDAEAAAVRRRMISATTAEEELRTDLEAYLQHDTTPSLDELHQQIVRLTQLTTKVV